MHIGGGLEERHFQAANHGHALDIIHITQKGGSQKMQNQF